MKRSFTASVWQEGDLFIAQCLELDVASQGYTEQEALENLREAVELYFEPPMPTRTPELMILGGCSITRSAAHTRFLAVGSE